VDVYRRRLPGDDPQEVGGASEDEGHSGYFSGRPTSFLMT
jgi:hypothetical protein